MRLPRFILSGNGWIRLWQQERRANAQLRRELLEWQNRVLEQARMRPLFQPPPRPSVPTEMPPIGLAAKTRYLRGIENTNNDPSAEQILEAASRAKHG